MTKSGAGYEMPRGGEGSLEERIKQEFDARLLRLDELQNASKVTQADWDFVEATGRLIKGLEDEVTGGFDGNSRGALETLRLVFDAAEANLGRAELVTAVEKKGKKKEKRERRETDLVFEEEEGGGEPEVPLATELTEKDFEGDDVAAAWFAAIHGLEEMIDAAEVADPSERRALFDRASDEYNLFMEESYEAEIAAIETAGESIENIPLFKVLGTRLDRMADRLETYYSAQVPEQSAEPAESLESIWARMNGEIQQLHAEINTLLDMPTGTTEEVAEARGTFEDIIANAKAYADDWKEVVSPILDGFRARKQRWGDWGPLAKEHGALMLRFFGRKAKNEGDESIEGVLQAYGRKLRDRSREIRREVWESEFPNFALLTAKTIINIQDARMRRGVERVEAMSGIAGSFAAMQEEWKTLRAGGPRVSREDREKGERSVVNQYDVILRSLGKDIPVLLKSAEKARPARLDDVAYLWREALVRTEQFWRAGTDFKEKIAFLRRYGSGEVEEKEIEEMIRTAERENFESVAESDVLADLRARGKQKRERREQTERRERARLYHPKLEMLRMEAKDMYRGALNARFWKDDVPRKRREELFAADAKIEDAELGELVTDISAYRRMVGMVNSAYKRVAEVEDPLYTEGKQPEGKVKAKQMRRVIERYLEAEEREAAAWQEAKHSRGWGIELSRRDAVLHYDFDRFWDLGERAFKDKEFLKAAPELRRAIVTWIFVRARLRTLWTYAQWLIDENPALAQSAVNMPRAFTIPEKEGVEEDEDDDTGEEVVSDAEKAELILPVQEDRVGDEAGGGAFNELETGAAADTSSREEDEGGEEEGIAVESGVETLEAREEGRKAALDTAGRKIVKALTE